MKKALFSVLIFLSTTYVYGQTEKGNYFLGGNLGLNFTSGYSPGYGVEFYPVKKRNALSITASFGYFFKKNIAFGMATNINSYSTTYYGGFGGADGKEKATYISLIPTLYYLKPIDEKLSFTFQLGIGYSLYNYQENNVPYYSSFIGAETGYRGFVLNGGVGFSYFVSNNVSLNLNETYDRYMLRPQYGEYHPYTFQHFSTNFGLTVFILKGESNK
jgi:hypothetical protein